MAIIVAGGSRAASSTTTIIHRAHSGHHSQPTWRKPHRPRAKWSRRVISRSSASLEAAVLLLALEHHAVHFRNRMNRPPLDFDLPIAGFDNPRIIRMIPDESIIVSDMILDAIGT